MPTADTIAKVNALEPMGTHQSEGRTTKQLLDAQKKFPVTLHQARPGEEQLTDKYVAINGHNYQIKRGEVVDVPESVYLALVQSGEIPPQRQEDRIHRPAMTYYPNTPLHEQTAQNAQ